MIPLEARLRRVLTNHRYYVNDSPRGLLRHQIEALASDLMPFVMEEISEARIEARKTHGWGSASGPPAHHPV